MADFPFVHTKNISHYPRLSAMPTKQDVWDWLHEHDGFDMLNTLYSTSGELVYVERYSQPEIPILVVSLHDYSHIKEGIYTLCSHSFSFDPIEDTYTLNIIPITKNMYEALKPYTEKVGGAEVYVK